MTDTRSDWQIAQGNACSCRGHDEWCPCQNTRALHSPAGDGERERIARIIDEEAFMLVDWSLDQCSDHTKRRWEEALAKADAILQREK